MTEHEARDLAKLAEEITALNRDLLTQLQEAHSALAVARSEKAMLELDLQRLAVGLDVSFPHPVTFERILGAIYEEAGGVAELHDILARVGLPEPTVLRHLKALHEAGVVHSHRDGQGFELGMAYIDWCLDDYDDRDLVEFASMIQFLARRDFAAEAKIIQIAKDRDIVGDIVAEPQSLPIGLEIISPLFRAHKDDEALLRLALE